jgi:hypothetical protein
MTKSMGTENSSGQMEGHTKETGSMVNSMERVYI